MLFGSHGTRTCLHYIKILFFSSLLFLQVVRLVSVDELYGIFCSWDYNKTIECPSYRNSFTLTSACSGNRPYIKNLSFRIAWVCVRDVSV